jgi:hypothetical protein
MCSLDRLVRLSLAMLSPFHTVGSRSFQAFLAPFRAPPFVPVYRHVINDYMMFETNYATLMGTVYIAYYLLLEPVAAVSIFLLRPRNCGYSPKHQAIVRSSDDHHNLDRYSFRTRSKPHSCDHCHPCLMLDCSVCWSWIGRKTGTSLTRQSPWW